MPRHPFRRLLAGALIFAAGLLTASGAVLRVKPGNTNAGVDGLSWTNAFPNPGRALALAKKGDELWIAAGSYAGPFTLPAGVSLFGGFAGNEGARAERNLFTNFSVLDGQLKTNVLTITPGATNDTRVDGLVLRNGIASSGAALRISGGSPVIANCQFFGNNAIILGNAIYVDASSTAVITNNYFAANGREITIPPTGGGAVAIGSANPRIENNSFVGNRARDGGAIYAVSATGLIMGNWFLNNEAFQSGGGILTFAAAPKVTHNRFYGNSALLRGGAVATVQGGSPLLFNNALLQNRAALLTNELRGGGGIFVDAASTTTVLNNTLVENSAPVGGILCSNRSAIIANNLVARGTSGIGGVTGLTLRRNNLFDNQGTNYVGLADLTGSNGNLAQDPQFATDPRRGLFALLPGSPCRNAGETNAAHAGALDLDGQPRTQEGKVDIGADEGDGSAPVLRPRVIYVATDGGNGRDGTSWNDAVASVQQGIDRASRTGGEVWVKAGNYTNTLTVRPFTHVYGGFVGTETNRAQRELRVHVTVLDGASQGSVAQLFGLDAGETLDGFTVRNGFADAGGGLLIGGDVRISNNRIELNQSGNPASATASRGGGGLFSAGGDPVIANNTFVRNLVFSRSSAIPAEGAALKLVAGKPTIANNVFLANFATNTAAGGEAAGGAVFVGDQAVPLLANNTFLGNHATPNAGSDAPDLGGTIHWAQGTNAPTTPACVINNLIAYNRSGLRFVRGTAPEFRNNLVWANDRGDFAGLADPVGSAGNLRADPQLATRHLDPHLAAASPARDAGDSTVAGFDWLDVDSTARVAGNTVDIGADEFAGTTPEITVPVIFVAPTGASTNAGTSWASAKKSVQDAIGLLAATGGEVWVQAGTYNERITVPAFVQLYGGFAGGETNRSARQPIAHLTVLDGSRSTNSPVVTITTFGDRSSLDGFRIQNGRFAAGAGIAVTGSPRIEHNLVVLNESAGNGGGLFSQFGSPRIANNVFAVNSAETGKGAGLFLDPPAGHRPVVVHNDFLDHSSTNAGAAIWLGSRTTFEVTDNIIAFNTSGIGGETVTATLARNCLFQNATNDFAGVAPGAGNVFADPGFVDWRQLRFHLRENSPCVDAGTPTPEPGATDLELAPRRVGAASDLGATEFQGGSGTPFVLTLTSPAHDSRYDSPGVVQLTVDFGDVTNLPALVEYLTSTGVVATATSSPFSASLTNLALGEHALHALAVMPGGGLSRSLTNVFRITTPAPTVQFPTLSPGRIFEAPFTLNLVVQWNKIGGQVVALDLLTNGVVLLQATNLPAGQSATNVTLAALPVGDYAVRGIVTDDLGIRGTNDVAFSVRLAPPPALLSRPEFTTNGGLSLSFTLPTEAAHYVLEHSTNFVTWQALVTNRGGTATNWLLSPPLTNAADFFRNRGVYP